MPLNRVPAPIMMTPIIKLFSSPNLLVKRDVSRDAVENASNGRVVRIPIWVCDIPRSFCIRPKMAPTLVRPGRRLKEIRMIPKNNNTLVLDQEESERTFLFLRRCNVRNERKKSLKNLPRSRHQ